MASRFDGLEDKADVDVYFFSSAGAVVMTAEGEPSASISEAIARIRFRKHAGAYAGGMIFAEGIGFVEEDDFDELLAAIRASVALKNQVEQTRAAMTSRAKFAF